LAGDELSVEREAPAHAIVLIPDLDLIDDPAAYDLDFIREFKAATGGWKHFGMFTRPRILTAAEP
jgi:hypothetical protein